MRNIVGILLLTATLFTSGAYAQETLETKDIVGIGAVLQKQPDGTVQVDGIIANAPAERIGIKIGDIILGVKSLPTTAFVDVHSLSLPEVADLIRGPIGVPVELSVTRGNSEPMEVSIVREKIEVEDSK